MNQHNGYFLGQKELKVFWQSWEVENPKAIVIVSHGLGEHGGRYRDLAESLAAEHYSVYAIDHRGHGHSYGRRGAIESFSYAVADLEVLLKKVEREHEGVPSVLLGHSMGGAIAVGYTLLKNHRLAGLILSGAALSVAKIPGPMRKISEFLAVLTPHLPTAHIAAEVLSRDPLVVSDFRADPLNLSSKIPLITLAQILQAVASLSTRLGEINIPLLAIHGELDQLVPAASSEYLHQHSRAEDKTLKVYPGLYHDVINEGAADKQQVIEDIILWLNQRFQ